MLMAEVISAARTTVSKSVHPEGLKGLTVSELSVGIVHELANMNT
jgi:hypothetical protein